MNRLSTLVAVLGIALAMLFPAAAQARIDGVTIENHSTRCAWITVYWAEFYHPFEIVNYSDSKPQFLRPGAKHHFGLAHPAEVKIRAEVTKNADCTGGMIADTYDVRKDSSKASLYLNAGLFNNDRGSYNLWFK
jgi:hypothetical protein